MSQVNEIAMWQNVVGAVSHMAENGVGLQCPWCQEHRVSLIESGILQLRCGTRIAMKKKSWTER